MKLALVHDFLFQDGGAERVLRTFQSIWPEAPTYTLIYNRQIAHPDFLNKDIRTSFIQKLPLGARRYQWFLPLMPSAIERFDLSDYDVVLSSSSAFAKGVISRENCLHVSYCHTPTRYLWSDTHTYINELGANYLVKKIIPLLLTNLRLWDVFAANRVDKFIANSETVRARIKKFYRRESEVINPPIETEHFSLADKPDKPENFYLVGGRLVGYKRFDIAVQAFGRLGIPLKIFGVGPAYEALRTLAKPNIEFLGKVSDEDKARLYQKCVAFLHPQEEDFGLTALEAMASGRPVVAFDGGGAKETVIPNKTGVFFDEQTWESLADTVIHFAPEKFNPEEIRRHALQFDTAVFKSKIKKYVERAWTEFKYSN